MLRQINTIIRQLHNNVTKSALYFSTNTISKVDNSDREKKLKILALEIDVLRHEGRKAPNPDLLRPQNWEYILGLSSKSARQKYYSFLWRTEKLKESAAMKKEKRKEFNLERKRELLVENETESHIIYGLMHTSYLLRIYDSTIDRWNNNKLISAMQYGQKLIMDCSYDDYMTPREAINAAKQLMLVFAENRIHDQPFDLHFCNADRNKTTMQYLHKHIPTLDEPWFPLNIHKESFIDKFPKEKLVYLTPHCKNDLEVYNHDDIYIIGAMVDKINNEPLSLGKAKKLGLRMARLPLDRYLQWGAGSGKSLTLNQMTSIMLQQKATEDWNESLKIVPRRKVFIKDRQQFQPDLKKYKLNYDKFRK